MNQRIHVFIQRAMWLRSVQLTFLDRGRPDDSARKIAQLEWVDAPNDDGSLEAWTPTISLQIEEAQQLMDELWNCGFRPTEGSGSAGSLAATEKHLKDMRRIAFAKLEVPQP